MLSTTQNLKDALQQYFGFDKFKGPQEEIIQSVLDGKDTFVIMPTGGGKSLCYQLPALIQEGTAIVISPLIALMKNQVDLIRGYCQNDEVAHFLNSSLNKTDIKKVKSDIVEGKTKLLYVAPETLTKEENIEFFKNIKLSFVAVDEAHCISEWGHDFRPEYRRIRTMIEAINDEIPIIALTATATEKVRADIVKNLDMEEPSSFITSFNRDNLYYEVRPKITKEQVVKEIVQVVKKMPGQSGIIYVQSRKATEGIAKILKVNDIKAAPYHAGLDAKTRSKIQDDFLMEEIDVICATIAFGMGIDKPDVRFVMHYDIPKSIENYYQETGRAGRDGLEGKCIAFFSPKDVLKLEKFLRDKPAAEREMGAQLLQEIIAYSETASCRRQFLLHYFGEQYKVEKCNKKCDNCKNPKEKKEVKEEMQLALQAVEALSENYGIKIIIDFLTGKSTKEMEDYKFDQHDLYANGNEQGDLFWHSIIRQAILHNYLYKEVVEYGILKLTKEGKAFIKKPQPVEIPINHDYSSAGMEESVEPAATAALDKVLLTLLKDERRTLAKEKGIPPYVIFQDPSLEDMATQYPISMDDMAKITGVSIGKAKRYGKTFTELIAQYVEENDIERPTDFVVKQVANKSKVKVAIIQSIDKKNDLEEVASASNLSMEELFNEMDMIVNSGTKLDLNYYIEENLDDDAAEEIYEYFLEAESDSVEEAFEELKEEDITVEEIQVIRIKFLSELAN